MKRDFGPMNEVKNVLDEARRCFRSSCSASYPRDFSVNSRWNWVPEKNVDEITQFETAEQGIRYVPDGSITGYDHRAVRTLSVCMFDPELPDSGARIYRLRNSP